MENNIGELLISLGTGGGVVGVVAWYLLKGLLTDVRKLKENQAKFVNKLEFQTLTDTINSMNIELVKNIENDKNRESAIEKIQSDIEKHQRNHHTELEKTITKMQSEIDKLKSK